LLRNKPENLNLKTVDFGLRFRISKILKGELNQMSKTISWPARVTYLFIALALALSLVLVAVPKTAADPGLTKWTKVTTPTDSNETIIQGADLYDLAVGPDGDTIYAIGKMPCGRSGDLSGVTIALWRSTDGGAKWSDKTENLLQDNVKLNLPEEFAVLSQVAVSPNDEDFVVVAGMDGSGNPMVVGSTNGADKFYYTNSVEDGMTGDIICLDVSRSVEDVFNVAVGTDDGIVWRYEAGTYWGASWKDATTYGTGWKTSTAVTSVIISPSWSADKTVLVISTDGTKTWLQSGKWGTTKGWGSEVERAKAVEFKVDTDSIVPIVHMGYGLPTGLTGVTGMAVPSDYNGRESSLRRVHAYVDTMSVDPNGGYFFRIDSTTLSPSCGPIGNPWLGSVAYYGDHDDGDLLLGMLGDDAPDDLTFTDCCAGVQVWRTDEVDICCPDWDGASKKPSGQLYAVVAFTPDGKRAYATTAGEGMGEDPCDESAFSVSLDKGKCWNQLGLIDTDIDYLSDVAVSPDCCVTYISSMNVDEDEIDNPCDGYLEQICECDSVWAKDCEADYYPDVWQRVYHKELDGCGILRLSPEHDDGDVVYWGAMGTFDLYGATSKGICKWTTKDAPVIEIQDFALADDDTLYLINNGEDLVKWTEAKGDWTSEEDHKASKGHTIAVLGDNVLVGGATGRVGYSDDAGDSFSRLGDKAELGSDGEVHVAFDSYFEDNATVYGAVNNGDHGIWRWVIDDSSSWDEISAGCAEDKDYFGIVLDNADGNPQTDEDTGGVLYAAFYDGDTSGVARLLGPATTACCDDEGWDCLVAKLTGDELFTREPSSLKICGCLSEDSNSELWAIDNRYYYEDYDFVGAKFITSAEGRLWTYEDCFGKVGIDLTAVGDGDMVASDPCICANEKFVLQWERLCNACEYEFDISLDEDFTQIVADELDYLTGKEDYYYLPPKGSAPSVVIDQGDIDCNTTFYWRVRAHYAETDEIIASWWSDTWSFTVEAGPSVAIDLASPDDGASNLPLTAIGFTWSSVSDATSYDWVLSANADLSSPVETKTGLTGTAYTYTGTLKTNTTYFWRVTAMKDGSVFSESDISTFTTAPAPVPPPPAPPAPPAPTTPAWVWVVIGIGAVLVIVVIVLIFRTRRV